MTRVTLRRPLLAVPGSAGMQSCSRRMSSSLGLTLTLVEAQLRGCDTGDRQTGSVHVWRQRGRVRQGTAPRHFARQRACQGMNPHPEALPARREALSTLLAS